MSVKSRIARLEARKGTKKKTAIIHLPSDMTDEDEVREVVDRLTVNFTEPFDELMIHDHDVTDPVLGWFGDLGELLDDIAANSKRIGVHA